MNFKLPPGYSTERGATLHITMLPTIRQWLSNIGADLFKEMIKYSHQWMVNEKMKNKGTLYKTGKHGGGRG